MKLLKNPTVLKDAVYNIALDSGSCNEYAKGIIVGAVAALMAMGMTFQDAITHVAIVSPDRDKMRSPVEDVIPYSWYPEYFREYMASHK